MRVIDPETDKLDAASAARAHNNEPVTNMLYWTAVFFVIAVIAAVFGFGGIAAASAEIAKILFFIFIVLFLISLIFGLAGRRRPPL